MHDSSLTSDRNYHNCHSCHSCHIYHNYRNFHHYQNYHNHKNQVAFPFCEAKVGPSPGSTRRRTPNTPVQPGRRRGRRMRSFWRREQMAIQMGLRCRITRLAGCTPRAAPCGARGQPPGQGERSTHYTAKFPNTPLPQPELFDVFEEELGGEQP